MVYSEDLLQRMNEPELKCIQMAKSQNLTWIAKGGTLQKRYSLLSLTENFQTFKTMPYVFLCGGCISAGGLTNPRLSLAVPPGEEREGPCEPLWGVVSHQVRHRGGVAGHHAGLHARQEVRPRVGTGQQRRGGDALWQQLRCLLLHQLLHALRLSGEPGGTRGLG